MMDTMRSWLRPLTGATGVRAPVQAGGLPPGKLMFRPQPFWQKLRDDHIAVAGIEFRLGMDDGVNYAKLKTKVEVDPDSDFANNAVKLVSTSKGDTEALAAVLREVAGSGNNDELRALILSCFVTQDAAAPAVCEAAKHNQITCLELLLAAGASPAARLSSKPALHFAMENVAEDCAMLLVDRLAVHQVYARDRNGRTAFEAAGECDAAGFSRRLQEYAVKTGKSPPEALQSN